MNQDGHPKNAGARLEASPSAHADIAERAGFLRKQHGPCHNLHAAGIQEMTQLAALAAGTAGFNETALRSTLQAIVARARATEDEISAAIAAGWTQGVQNAMQDGILTADEETNLRDFRDRMADQDLPDVITGSATLDRAAADRIAAEARHAALSTGDGGAALQELDNTLRRASMSNTNRQQLLIRAREEAVEGALEDGVISLDEENALSRYLDRFELTNQDVNRNGAHTSVVQAAVIRDITMGIIPQRQNITGRVPFNLMKSEQLVWVIDGVDYLETLVRQGTSHGLSVRVARGVYYRPSTFRSRHIEWEETVHADTGLLGFTTKHLYYASNRKKFRVRYDRIVSFDPYNDGFGIMRDAQTSRTGDGWFAYNLAVNIAQILHSRACAKSELRSCNEFKVPVPWAVYLRSYLDALLALRWISSSKTGLRHMNRLCTGPDCTGGKSGPKGFWSILKYYILSTQGYRSRGIKWMKK